MRDALNAASLLGLAALVDSLDDVLACLNDAQQHEGNARYDRRISAYNEQIARHRAAMAALNEALANAEAASEKSRAPTEEDAHQMGAYGAEATEAERLLFEAWMSGHCWALSAMWDGSSYRSDAEVGLNVDPRAMATRLMWAAWRDRAALARQVAA